MITQRIFLLGTILLFQIPFAIAQSACGQLQEISGYTINCQRTAGSTEEVYQAAPIPDAFYDGQYAAFVVELGNKENQMGIRLFEKKKYKQALTRFKNAAKYLPDNEGIRQNILQAEAEVKRSELKREISQAELGIHRDLAMVKKIGVNSSNKEFEEWIKLLEEERKGLVYFFIGSLVESVNQRLKTVSKLKRADARIESKVRKYLQKMGRQVPSELSTHLKAIEKDIKNVEKVSKALTFIEYSMKAADAGDKLSKKEWLEIAKMVLELGLSQK